MGRLSSKKTSAAPDKKRFSRRAVIRLAALLPTIAWSESSSTHPDLFHSIVKTSTPVFPGTTWEPRTPAEAGMDQAKLDAFREYLGSRVRLFVTRSGYQVYTAGDVARRADVASAHKPFNSFLVFQAVAAGLLPSLDTKVNMYEPCVNTINARLGYKDREVTFRHMANQISNYGVTEAPGTAFNYNDWQMALFEDTLINKVYGVPWSGADEYVFYPRLWNYLQPEDSPSMYAQKRKPGRVTISVRDFARFGLLFLRGGTWNGTEVIGADFVQLAVTSPVSNELPQSQGIAAEMCPGQRTDGSHRIPDNNGDHGGSYSWLWWINGVDRYGARKWPDAPLDTYAALGHTNRRALVVIPSLDLVVSWNDADYLYDAPGSGKTLNDALRLLVASMSTTPARVSNG